MDFISDLILNTLRGEVIIETFNDFYNGLSSLNQLLMLVSVGIFAIAGTAGIFKLILKITGMALKVILILALIGVIVFFVFGFNPLDFLSNLGVNLPFIN